MALKFTPSKRHNERNSFEPNGRAKWQKTGPFSIGQKNQLKAPQGASILRVLCPASKFGSIVGKGGGIIAKIRQETGAKIRIEETVPRCEERVVVITGSEKVAEVSKERNKENNEESASVDVGEGSKESVENDEEKEDLSALEGSEPEKTTSSVQKALLLVYERLVEGELEDDAGDGEGKKATVSVRLLIFSIQVGCLLGKGGSVIKQMSTDSGANIRILPKDALPLCASPIDEIVQITGGVNSARKALQSVSQLLLENPTREFESLTTPSLSGPSSHPFGTFPRPEGHPPTNFHLPAQGPPFSNMPYESADYHSTIPQFPHLNEMAAPGQMQVLPVPITYRLLCSNDKVGSVIGKGGSIIKTLQNETGCQVKILETTPESDDRIVAISGPALPGDQISPAQDAVLRVQERIMLAVPDNKDNTIISRIIVPSNQIGCLLGKGGAVIAEMRKLSRAHIRIMGKDQIVKNVAEDEEVIQITGEFRAVQDALLQITTRLRLHLFRDRLPALNHTAHLFVDQMPPFGPNLGRREPSPPRLYSNFPPPFQNDSGGRPHEERSGFAHMMHGSGVPLHVVERMPSVSWAPQNMREGGGSMLMPDYVGVSHRRIAGFPGGNSPAVITNTIVEVVVPRALVPSIYGEDGFCLRRIREISEAKITITEPRPEETETVIIISGTPEQTHAAQSLLQAFVLSESVAP